MVTWNSRNYGSALSWQIIPVTDDELAQGESKMSSDRSDYQVVWEQEFNENGSLDEKDWNFETGFVRNHEDQWYQSDNVHKKDGNLVFEARKEHRDNPWYEAGSSDWKKSRQYIDYTSACVTTAGKHDWLYGRVEVCAKIPCYSGSWPAIWMLGNESVTGEWPSSGEIDITGVGIQCALAGHLGSSQYACFWLLDEAGYQLGRCLPYLAHGLG